MKFGVLGPYLIFPEHPHRIGTAKHRRLLAILTVNANHFVTVERLADELWLGEPPVSAANLIRQYVGAIRRRLPGSSGTEMIRTMPGGYRLLLEEGDLDRDEFDRLFRVGQVELSAGRPERGAEALSDALAKWRGDPLADLERSPSIAAEARRLEERRLAATELRIEAELRRGRHTEVVDELAALVTLYPERERLRAHQMQALYATGRRADALTAYREGREALIDTAGIEPGPELQRVHRQVLTDDLPVEPRAVHAVTPSRRRRLAPLPVDVPDLVAREREVAFLQSAVTQPVAPETTAAAPVVVISGKAGIGKSVLAVRVGHLLGGRFPDGQLFLPLSELTTEQALRQALQALGLPAVGADLTRDEVRDLYRVSTHGRRVLVLLDDAASENQVRDLIPSGPRSAVIVTSRSTLAGIEGAKHLLCTPLSQAAAVRMLAGIIGEERASADAAAVRDLVDRLGRLPLALRIAGAILVLHEHRPVDFLLDRLAKRNPIDELSHGDLTLRARLAPSYERLGVAARKLFRRLSLVPGDRFDLHAASTVSELDTDVAEKVLDHLVDVHLVEPAGMSDDGRVWFAMDELARAYARERLQLNPE
ncbi:BTAD domain-containing putative transcriptional regulator [Phytohabitans sp. LJ34]|uniref:AfsR/SARP family transcriptional regulator n=1 Tax=Phytohabitans sp. LJ34 TaxID=3452217 RepID=UPI003F8C4248